MASSNPNTTPASPPPAGQHSNLDNPSPLQPCLVATCVICLSSVVLAISARTFVKAYILRKVQWEDCKYCNYHHSSPHLIYLLSRRAHFLWSRFCGVVRRTHPEWWTGTSHMGCVHRRGPTHCSGKRYTQSYAHTALELTDYSWRIY